MSSIQYVGKVLSAFADVFEPLQDALDAEQSLSALLAGFGWQLDPAADINKIRAGFADLPPLLNAIQDAVTAFDDSSGGGQTGDILAAVAELGEAIAKLVDGIQALSGVTPDAAWPPPLNSGAFWETFSQQLFEYLLFEYLEFFQPKIFSVLRLAGVLTEDFVIPPAAGRVPYTKRAVRWDRLLTAVTAPQELPRDVYQWGEALEAHRLLDNLKGVAVAFDRPAVIHEPSQALLDTYYNQAKASRRDACELSVPVYWKMGDIGGALALLMLEVALLPIPPDGQKDAPAVGLCLYPRATGDISGTIQLSGSVSLVVTGKFNSDAFIRAEIRPADVHIFVDPNLTGTLDGKLTLDATPPQPWIPLGDATSSRLELRKAHASIEARGTLTDPEFLAEIAADDAALIIQFNEGDSFLAQVLAGVSATADLSLGITWSSKKGFRLSGEAELEITIPIHQSIGGVIDLDSITIGVGAQPDPPAAKFSVAITGGLNIGPVSASVDRVGVQAKLMPVASGQPSGNLGNATLALGFLPPKGLGLAIDAGPVSGGGYIELDTEKGRYAGILQLTLPVLSITVIGLLDTKLPGGKQGYSFLLIMACNFPPIQLGYGFVLTGLGGLAGINRTVVVQALQDCVHTGSVDHILFPQDPIAHAAELISDLETIFPPTEGQYVFGPMAELGWGEPDPIITAQLGIMLTLPNPIVIILLGKLEIALPEPGSPVVDLRVQIAGSLDLTNKLLAIDATLRDSHLLAFSLSGDVSMRLSFGAQPNFVFAIGGFNAHFQAPPNFPHLERISLALSTGDNPRLSLDTYIAVTSNTFQIGAHASAYVSFGDFKASGTMGFDALFHFQPFSFQVGVEADVAVTGPLGFSASVHLDALLTGPDPIRVQGTLVIHCLGTHNFPIDIEFGQPAVEAPATPPDLWPQLQAEIGRTGNWSATLPPGDQRIVSVAQSETTGDLVFVDPNGGLTLRQKALPLDRTIDKFGQARLAAPVRFSIGPVSVGTIALGVNALTAAPGPFAAAQFEQMSDAEQLSRPSFEQMNAGVSIADGALAFGSCQGRDYQYETRVLDNTDRTKRSIKGKPYQLSVAAQQAAHLVSPAAKAPSRTTGMGTYSPSADAPPAAKMVGARYVIADVATLADKTAILAAAAVPAPDPPVKGAMMQALKSYYAKTPSDRGKYAVMGAWEVA